jgi:TPR repeat protein
MKIQPRFWTLTGMMYLDGKGVAQDYIQGYMWSAIARDSGVANAANNVEIAEDQMTEQQINTAHARVEEWKTQHGN